MPVVVCRDVSSAAVIDGRISGVQKLMESYKGVDLSKADRGNVMAVLNEVFDQGRVTEAVQVLNELALSNQKRWVGKTTLKVFFLNDPLGLAATVMVCAREWSNYANMTFAVSSQAESDIRVSFKDLGSWSQVGTECQRLGKTEATMNFGDFDGTSTYAEIRATVLHEFGHALGCIHEHQSPAAGIKWNTSAVYKYYGDPAIGWTRKMIDDNVLVRYGAGETTNSAFDPESIMLYPVPIGHTLDGFSSEINMDLSRLDRSMIRSLYP